MVQIDYYIAVVLALSICYTLTFGYCMYKTNKFGYFNDEWKHTKIFYFSVIIQTFIRMTTYALLTFAVTKHQRSHTFILVMRSVPDTLFFINYVLLVYQTVNIFYHSHMENRLHISLLKHFTRPKFRKARKLLSFLSLSWLCFMGLIYALLILNKLSGAHVDLEFTIVNLLSGTLVLLYLMYLYSKYSETPFKSPQDQVNLKIVSRVLMAWTLGRYLKGFLGLLDYESTDVFNYLSNPQKSDIGNSIVFVLENLITDIFCFYIVMDCRFINIFISQDVENMKKLDEFQSNEDIEVTVQDTFPLFVEKKSIDLLKPFNKRRNGLGELFSCKFNGNDALYRKVSFSGETEFTADGLTQFLAAVLELPEIGLIYPAPGRSVHKALHEDKSIISLKEKLKILREVGFTLKVLHEKGSFHGHLSSHNVILYENHTLLADFGLFTLKKYFSTNAGYCNKGYWTSPEQWLEKGNSVTQPHASDDVFSFGVLVWEVLTGELPLENIRTPDLAEEVGNKKRTPRVPGYFPKTLKKLLELCWSPLGTRGNMENVYQKLAGLRFEGDH